MDLRGSPQSTFIDPHVLPVPMFAFWEQMALPPPVMPGEGAAMDGRPDCSCLCRAVELEAQPVLVLCPHVLPVPMFAFWEQMALPPPVMPGEGAAMHGRPDCSCLCRAVELEAQPVLVLCPQNAALQSSWQPCLPFPRHEWQYCPTLYCSTAMAELSFGYSSLRWLRLLAVSCCLVNKGLVMVFWPAREGWWCRC